VFIQSRSGLPFSYTFDNSRSTVATLGGQGFDNDFGNIVSTYSGRQAQSNQLLYVPATDANGNVTATSDPRVTYGGAFDLAAFNTLLRNTGLIRYAGGVAPRNGFHTPSVTTMDIHLSQELPAFFPGGARVQAYLDIENFGNLLNNRWGLLEQYDFYRGVPVVAMTCVGGTPLLNNIAGSSCAGATSFQYTGLRQSNPGNPTRPFTQINASLWQIKVGLRYRF
jgi:hypothetical protein